MRAFDYIPAKTVNEAVALLAEKGDQAKPLSGGTDLIVMVREGRRQLELMVDIKDIPETNVLSYSRETGLHLGATVPCYEIYADDEISAAYPGLADAAKIIGGHRNSRQSKCRRQFVQCLARCRYHTTANCARGNLRHCGPKRNARRSGRAVLHGTRANCLGKGRISRIV